MASLRGRATRHHLFLTAFRRMQWAGPGPAWDGFILLPCHLCCMLPRNACCLLLIPPPWRTHVPWTMRREGMPQYLHQPPPCLLLPLLQAIPVYYQKMLPGNSSYTDPIKRVLISGVKHWNKHVMPQRALFTGMMQTSLEEKGCSDSFKN